QSGGGGVRVGLFGTECVSTGVQALDRILAGHLAAPAALTGLAPVSFQDRGAFSSPCCTAPAFTNVLPASTTYDNGAFRCKTKNPRSANGSSRRNAAAPRSTPIFRTVCSPRAKYAI